MLPRNQRQEALSRAYVRAVAAQAGVICNDVFQDYGIDLCLRAVGENGRRYSDLGDQFDLQLKSTTRAIINEAQILYDLEVRDYDVLRRTRTQCPRFLVVLVLPGEESQWLTQSVEELILRRCAYWFSLRGAPAVTAHTTTRITVPRGNVFSVEAVQAFMRALTEGGIP
jgi:hypothetical protein